MAEKTRTMAREFGGVMDLLQADLAGDRDIETPALEGFWPALNKGGNAGSSRQATFIRISPLFRAVLLLVSF